MKKFFSILVLIFFTAVYLLSTSDFIMKKVAPFRYELDSPLGSDKYRYGDLYGLCYLKDFKIYTEKKQPVLSDCKKPGDVNLYMICDSYLWSFVKTDSIFCNVNKLKYARWLYFEQVEEKMDTAKKNILIIESSERFARKLLKDTADMYSSMRVSTDNPKTIAERIPESLWEKILRYLYNENINQNLEFNLFDYRFLTPFKELKAELNYRLFGRTNNDVSVSSDKKYLLYGPTADSTKTTSSFNPFSDKEIDETVMQLNREYEHFKTLGFDEIYLSLIPNPVSIVDPGFGKYNNFINRIQNSTALRMPVIDIYNIFRKIPGEVYFRSDSHWNYEGFQIWVYEVNKRLKYYSH